MSSSLFKKPLAVAVILLFFSVSVIPSTGTTDVKQITMPTSSGNTLYVGGNGSGNYTTIQSALDDTINGDTVFVYDDSSPYYENVVVKKSINLIGEDRDTTIIDGNKKDNIVNVSAMNVTILGFTIQNTSDIGSAIKLFANNSTVVNNNIKDFDNGVLHYLCGNHTISENIFISNLSIAIHLFYSSNNIVTNNSILNLIGGGAISLYKSSNNIIIGNTVDHGNPYMSHSSNHNIWSDNLFGAQSTMCIYKSSNENTITNNTFRDSEKGMIIDESHDNKIYHNRFINNWRGNAYDKGNNFWDNGYPLGGNYWDDYSDNDYDNDSIGDSPYNISGGSNKDNYPLGYFDYEPPIIDVITPEEGFLYLRNFKIIPLSNITVFLGPIVFLVNVTDYYFHDVYKITYYIDGTCMGSVGGLNKPYKFGFSRLRLIDFSFFNIFKHRFTISFEAVDCHGNKAREDITVWMFL